MFHKHTLIFFGIRLKLFLTSILPYFIKVGIFSMSVRHKQTEAFLIQLYETIMSFITLNVDQKILVELN